MPSRSSRPHARLLRAGAVLLGLGGSTGSAVAGEVFSDEDATRALVDRLTGRTVGIRGLALHETVPVMVEDPATMRAHMQAEIDRQLEPEDIEATELTWRLLGLADDDFDLAATYVDVLEEGVAGYFDIEDKRLVLVKRPGGSGAVADMMRDMVISHELVHALQDQHFDLWSTTRRQDRNSDTEIALQALIEGDASYAMLYTTPFIDPDELPIADLTRKMAEAGGPGEDMGGLMGSAPAMVREPLIFPYVQGLAFASHVKRTGEAWIALDAAYASPPLSTEMVLHPERYTAATPDWPTRIEPADCFPGRRWSVVEEDSLGELGIRVFLRHHGAHDVANRTADGWDGDTLVTLKRGDRGALVWISVWDSDEDAAEWEAALNRVLSVDTPSTSWAKSSVSGNDTRGVSRDGARVTAWIAVPASKRGRMQRCADRATTRELRSLDDLGPPEPRPDAPAAD